ncbi:tripartite tricarboxylate transporter TctB family protein [Parapusillimonas granuli]|uniref:Tripartite tricarboxylate transporter TctB family protein n=1 Tax=Parapusillimonas granuli TaxID=380911 RepID=A0A853FTK2_9BURK|nr:tripartite tricarboxylate transporter TctB family protein [Parapusillimonas granuli]MBB5216256.1 putative tricarboxylic transport membrane protein [Parapusillimonas granuli]MEB2400530.1 tripartite tricarboxylate transporter TctB family protein [Alcaligenaceae bacterium]NYT47933.1 tripartite tricarboxylate transporter TctB family protein [Parapusillimonas granuli]
MSAPETSFTPDAGPDRDSAGGPSARASAAVGVALMFAAAALWMNANQLPPAGGMGVGPSAALRLVSGLLLALSVAHFLVAWRSRGALAPSGGADKAALAWAIGGLVATTVLVAAGGGFVLASTTLFMATARAFGKPLGMASLGIGLILAITASLFFTLALTLSLPAGPVESLLYPGS